MDCVPELPSQSDSGPLLDHLRLAWISGKRAANPPNLAHKEAMHTQIGVGFRAFWAHPSPTPYVDPIPPKVTQCHPRIGRGSQLVKAARRKDRRASTVIVSDRCSREPNDPNQAKPYRC
jgi:hypothetical protein